jgi:hypothetical protein
MEGMTWMQWVQVVEIPAIGMLASLLYKNRRELQAALDELRLELHQFEVKVAETYATNSYLKDVEVRLVRALSRIEEKLDRTIERERR